MKVNVRYEPIDRRDRLSVREFHRDYFGRNKPVVITGAINGWKARSGWTFENFKSRFGKSTIRAYGYGKERHYREERVERMPLAEYVDRILAHDFDAYP